MKKYLFFFTLLGVASITCAAQRSIDFSPIPNKDLEKKGFPTVYTYQVVKTYPHNTDYFTEGLTYQDGYFYESTGIKSRLLKISPITGKVVKITRLPKPYFAEGIAIMGNKIYQLTYLSNTGFIYDKNTFKRIGRFHYTSQGWGLTNDKHHLIMSNGSSSILFIDPKTFKVIRKIHVHVHDIEVGYLNELEYIKGRIYANVFKTHFVAIISPKDGHIIGWINLKGLNPDPSVLKGEYVLNGVAFNNKTGNLIVTGKTWPKLYEIRLIPLKKASTHSK